jgi:hypothetical protein
MAAEMSDGPFARTSFLAAAAALDYLLRYGSRAFYLRSVLDSGDFTS